MIADRLDLLKQLGQKEQEVADDEEDERDDDMDIKPPPPKLKNFKEAVESLKDV